MQENEITTPEKIEEVQNLDKVINESKITLLNSEQKEIKKRGRPAKSITSDNKATPVAPLPAPIPAGPSPMKPTFTAVLSMTDEVLKLTLETDCFKLNEFEREILATQMDELAKEFAPTVSGKGSKALMLAGTAGVIYGSKYLKFINEQAEKQNINNSPIQKENGIKND